MFIIGNALCFVKGFRIIAYPLNQNEGSPVSVRGA